MAFLLDTNVVSELRKKGRVAPSVAAWYRANLETDMFISVLTLGELRRGVESLRGRDPQTAFHLDGWLVAMVQRYALRILSVDLSIADLAGRLCSTQRLPIIDGLLAATALHHDMTLVTRNIADVKRAGVNVFNPFDD